MSCLLGKHRSVRDKSATAPAGCRTHAAQLEPTRPIRRAGGRAVSKARGRPALGTMGRLVGMAAFPFLRRGERRRPTLLLSMRGLPSAFATAGVIAAAALALTPGPAAAASLISGFKAGVLTDENTSNPEEKDYATQAGSHPEVAFTNFSLNTLLNAAEFVRVDLPPGLSVNPQAIPRCTYSGLELESKCASDTQVGKAKIKVVVLGITAEASGKVYNMTPSAGSPGEFAFAVTILGLVTVRTNLVAGLRYYPSSGQPGDYGEYFTINEISSAASLALSELDFWGAPEEHNGGGATNNAFLTNPTVCAGPQTTNMFARTYGSLVSEGTLLLHHAGGCERLLIGAIQPHRLAHAEHHAARQARCACTRRARAAGPDALSHRELAAARSEGEAAGRGLLEPIRGERPEGVHRRRVRRGHEQRDHMPGGLGSGDRRNHLPGARRSAHGQALRRDPEERRTGIGRRVPAVSSPPKTKRWE